MNRLACASLSAFLLALSAVPASAAAIIYSNEAAFAAATSSTLHPLPVGPNGTFIQANTITTTDGALVLAATIPGPNLISNWEAFPGSVSHLPGPDLAISGFEHLDANVAFSSDRYAFGFGFYEPSGDATITGCNAACVESTFTITLFNNMVAVGSPFVLVPVNNTALFWGVHTDFAFDAIQIRETTGGIDNEFFGTFYSGRIAAAPEPATLLLFGTALAFRLRRRR
jgi:hypothetical protein